MPLFMQLLLDNHFPPYFCPMVMGLSFLLPHLNNFYFLQLCERKGTYYVIRSLLVIKLMMALGVMTADLSMLWLIAVFIASNRIFTEGICRLCDLIVADLIDQDYVENEREVIYIKRETLEMIFFINSSKLKNLIYLKSKARFRF